MVAHWCIPESDQWKFEKIGILYRDPFEHLVEYISMPRCHAFLVWPESPPPPEKQSFSSREFNFKWHILAIDHLAKSIVKVPEKYETLLEAIRYKFEVKKLSDFLVMKFKVFSNRNVLPSKMTLIVNFCSWWPMFHLFIIMFTFSSETVLAELRKYHVKFNFMTIKILYSNTLKLAG